MIAASNRQVVALCSVKLVHTFVWAFFAGCIVTIPVVAWHGQFTMVLVLAGIVLVEVAVLILNRWRCPLTSVASRYTNDRADNFDIFLPVWLARHNKVVFGWLYVVGLIFAAARWRDWL
jgi:hypothetical protein